MKKFILTFFLILSSTLPTFAYEDCILKTNGRLSNISIEDNTIIDVHPLITVMNEKNTLIIHPLKEGVTCFSILKNNKEKFIFTVRVEKDETFVSPKEKFEILYLDAPPEWFNLDLPPQEIYGDLEEPPILKLDEPPILRKKEKFNG